MDARNIEIIVRMGIVTYNQVKAFTDELRSQRTSPDEIVQAVRAKFPGFDAELMACLAKPRFILPGI
jgi:hypothetical protein